MSNQDKDMDGTTYPASGPGSGPGWRPGSDAWLEALLRADAAAQPHIADDGFADRLMRRLPAPRKPAPRWIVPTATALGSAAALLLTPAGAWFAHSLQALFDFRSFSPAHLIVLVPVAMFYAMSFSALRDR